MDKRFRMVTAWGETKKLGDWTQDPRCVVSQPSLTERLDKGMNPEEAISTPRTYSNKRPTFVPVKIGDQFGRLEVIESSRMEPKGKQMASKVKCKCECGNITDVFVNSLRSKSINKTTSCGCSKAEKASQRMTEANLAGLNRNPTHNMSRTKLYKSYYSIINRCYYENHVAYKHYGERGIKMCDEWKNDFTKFAEWAMSNGYDGILTIERINTNGNYCPENCKYDTKKNQANNTRRNVFLEYNGERKTLALWAEDQRCIVDYNTLRYRILYYGWNTQDAIITPSIRK